MIALLLAAALAGAEPEISRAPQRRPEPALAEDPPKIPGHPDIQPRFCNPDPELEPVCRWDDPNAPREIFCPRGYRLIQVEHPSRCP